MNTVPDGFRPTDYIMAQHLGHSQTSLSMVEFVNSMLQPIVE